jgi:hypothetical protein
MCLRRYGLGACTFVRSVASRSGVRLEGPSSRSRTRTPRQAGYVRFSGGEQGAAKVLINMDFDVVAEEEPFTIRCGGQAATETDREEGRASFRGVSGVLHGAAGDRGMRRLRLIRLVLAWHRA